MELVHSFESVGTEIFAIAMSQDGSLIAAACNDGAVRVFHTATKKLQYTLGRPSEDALPIMGVRFRPAGKDSQGARHVLLAVGCDGSVRRWHVSTGRKLFDTHEEDNEVFACDYRFDGQQFATAGRDKAVRVYDDERLEVVTKLEASIGGSTAASGHTNRVFSVRFSDESPHTLLSGGWDKCVHVWDTRTGRSQRTLFGANVCGDGVDVRNGVVVTAACRPEDPLQLWDLGTGKVIRSVKWPVSKVGGGLPCNLYSAVFSGDDAGRFLAAGGAVANEARLFERARGDAHVGTAAGFGGPVFAVAWHEDRRLAVAGGDGVVRLLGVSGGSAADRDGLSVAALLAEEEAKGEAATASAAASSHMTVKVGDDAGGAHDAGVAHPGSPARAGARPAGFGDDGDDDEWGAAGSGEAAADLLLAEARDSARSGAGGEAADEAASSPAGGAPVLAGSGAQAARQLARARAAAPAEPTGGASESKDDE